MDFKLNVLKNLRITVRGALELIVPAGLLA